MKNVILPIALVAILFSACESGSSEGTKTAADSSAVDSSACCAKVDSVSSDSLPVSLDSAQVAH